MKRNSPSFALPLLMCFSMAIGLLLTAPVATQAQAAPSRDTDGRYLIGNEDDLFGFAELVNGGEHDADAKLTANIAMTGQDRPWTPIAPTDQVAYAGTFDGQGYTISNLYFNDESAGYGGLFGYLKDGAIVKNVTIANGFVAAKNAGAIAGFAAPYGNATIEGCGNSGATISASSDAGGIVGSMGGTVVACWNTAAVSSASNAGGICGWLNGALQGCWNSGSVSGGNYVGGIVGLLGGGDPVSYCYNEGEVKASGTTSPGAIVGATNDGKLPNMSHCRYYRNNSGALDAYGGNSYAGSDVDDVDDSMLDTGGAAYLLNQGLEEKGYQFYQNLDNDGPADATPVLNSTHGTVFQGYKACAEALGYSNSELSQSFYHGSAIAYEADGSTVREVCANESCSSKTRDLGGLTLVANDALCTGLPIGATVEGSLTGGGSYTLTYDGAATAPSAAGKHTVTMTVSEGGAAKQAVTVEYEISYLPAPELSGFVVEGCSYSADGVYWFKGGTVATIMSPTGYVVSTTQGGAYGDSTALSEVDGGKVYLKRTSDDALTDAVDLSGMLRWDTGSPEGEISLSSESTWKSLLNKITFGLFFKDGKTAGVYASDAGSGVKSVEYYVANEDLIADSALDDAAAVAKLEAAVGDGWVDYDADDPIDLGLTSAYVVYARVTDNVGNVTYISSDGIVLYEDAVLTGPEAVAYDHGEVPEFAFDLNGNALESVKVDNVVLSGDHYTISASSDLHATLVIKKEYLDTLTAGEHVVTLSFAPLGYDFVERDGNDQPADLSISLTVKPWRIEIPAADMTDFVYDGSEQTYNITSSDWYTVSGNKQINAGDYTVAVSLKDKDNSVWADGTTEDKTYEFCIAKADYDMSAAKWDYAGAFTYDGTECRVEVTGLPAGVTVAGYVGNAAVEPGDYEAAVSLGYDAQNYNEPKINPLSWSIESAWVPTEGVEDTEGVTPDNVTLEDRDSLEKAKEDLEAALNDEAKNYSDEAKAAIEDEIKRIDDALEVIGNVEEVEALINKLPEKITKDDEAAVKAADEAYDALTDYEKSLVSEDAKQALEDAKADLAKANKVIIAATGDASPAAAVFAVSLGAAVLLLVSRRMERAA